MNFKDFKIDDRIQKAIIEMNYETPSEIQEKAIPVALEGSDILGCAQTGTGKTCAFMVPIINKILNMKTNYKSIKALILTPTRELAIQIDENTKAYAKNTNIKSLAIFGGVKEGKQKESLRRGVDILIATPGRLLDFIHQNVAGISHIETLVLDEADRMLDMGFINDVKKIIGFVPKQRQTLLFSATMPDSIKSLCDSLLKNPAYISVTPPTSTVDKIDQRLYFVDKANKPELLIELLKKDNIYNALVFTRTKHGADKLAKILIKKGIKADAIHGDKSQNARQHALENFKNGDLQVLVATDIAARGIDVNKLSHVFNFDLPETPETYVHRIGRTARAGADGISISFCSYDELDLLKDIKKTCKCDIKEYENSNFPMQNLTKSPKKQPQGRNKRPQNNKGSNNSTKENLSRPNKEKSNNRKPKALSRDEYLKFKNKNTKKTN